MTSRVPLREKDIEIHTLSRPKYATREHGSTATSNLHEISPSLQTAGNLATQRLLHSGAVQPGLAVSQPGDLDEQEADRVANEVVAGSSDAVVQCAWGGIGAESSPLGHNVKPKPQVKAEPVPEANAIAKARDQNRAPFQLGGGQPLAEPEKAFFESRLGHDLSHVRVHTDAKAEESARAVNAIAYTVGRNIFFAEGRYNSHTESGKRLLAHELAHTVQQNSAKAARVQRSLLPGGSGDWHEKAQAIVDIIAGLDLVAIAMKVAPIAINEAGAYTTAGGDYGPQNALRHCIFAGLLDSWGWRAAIAEFAVGVILSPLLPFLPLVGATMALRVRLVLLAHEWFGDEGCGNFGTGTVDSECDQHNNEVGLSIGGPFTSDADVISAAKAALDGGMLWMTPGPKDLSRTVSTAGWRSSPWMAGGPQQQDCSYVVKK